jgi:signal transduction histidine kinase
LARYRILAAVLTVILLAIVSGCGMPDRQEEPKAKGGVLDLRDWRFEQDGRVDLRGTWTFYPNQLLTSAEAAGGKADQVVVPGTWNNYSESYGINHGKGYGTYRILILTDTDEPTLSIRVPNVFTAYKLLVNGEEIASRGTVSASEQDAVASQSPQLATFVMPASGEIELLFQVSNYHHRRGGIWVDPKLGATPDMIEHQTRLTAQSMVLFGSLTIVGLYHIALFARRREESFTLHFGLLCIFIGLRTIVTGETLLQRWMPGLSWETGLKIDYASLTLSALSAYMYIFSLFPHEASKRVGRAIVNCSMILCSAVLLFPAYHYSRLLSVFQLFIVAVSLFILYALFTAKRRNRDGAGFVLIGVLVFTLTVLNDMVYYNEWYMTTELVPIGLFFFILMQAVILSSRFSGALRKVETISGALRELNLHLEDRIEERTDALRRSKEKLEASNRRLERMERSRRHLMTNISHDLRTPMTLIQGYLEALQDGVVQGVEQQGQYIRMALGKIGGLNRMIGDLFELAKLESGQVPLRIEPVSVQQWACLIRDNFGLDVESRGMAFAVVGMDAIEAEAVGWDRVRVNIDEGRMNQVLANLVYNALKYMHAGGRLTIGFRFLDEPSRLEVSVTDTGEGISAEDMPYLFDRFYKKDKPRASADSGSGIGLAIVKEIIELHNGTIEAASEPGQGTTFRIVLPAKKEEA